MSDDKQKDIHETLDADIDSAVIDFDEDVVKTPPVVPFWTRLGNRFKNRNSIIALVVFFIIAGIGFFAFAKLNVGNNLIKSQVVNSLDEMGIVFEADSFRMPLFPTKFEIANARFTNKKTGEVLFYAKGMRMNMRILDIFKLSLSREVRVDSVEIDGLEVWIVNNKDGSTNFEGIEISDSEGRVKLLFESSKVAITNGLVHFNEKTRKIGIDGSNILLSVVPADDSKLDAEKLMKIDLVASKSSFVYGDKGVDPIDIILSATGSGEGISVSYLKVTSDLGSSVLTGDLQNWTDPEYSLTVNTTVDLDKMGSLLPLNTPITGTGKFKGTIKGRGEEYKVNGEIISNDLYASNIRLKALKVNAAIDGKSAVYEGHGRAIAELLTFEDFVINYPQLVGTIRGSGTDFRWFGELQAIAARTRWGTVSNLILADASAEYQGSRINANLGDFRASNFSSPDAELNSIVVRNAKIRTLNGETVADIPSARAGKLDVEGATVRDLELNGAQIKNRDSTTEINANNARAAQIDTNDARVNGVNAKNIRVRNQGSDSKIVASNVSVNSIQTNDIQTGAIDASGVEAQVNNRETKLYSNRLRIAKIDSNAAVLQNLNIGGVRISIRDGIIEGTTDDFDAGDIDLKENGQLNGVRVKKPVFVLEPSGQYRASMDMSIGGGLLGKIKLGKASAQVNASSDLLALDSLQAEVLDGSVKGDVEIATNNQTRSKVAATFEDLNAGQLLALMGGQVFPIEGNVNGLANLNFYGSDLKTANGTVSANVEANAGNEDDGLIPLTGVVDLQAVDGLFTIENGFLNTPSSALSANGKFDLRGDNSDMNFLVDSRDASEIDHLFRVLNVSDDAEAQLDKYNAEFAGNFSLRGTLKGNFANPIVAANTSLDSLSLNGKTMGSLSGNIAVTPAEFAFSKGKLTEPDGGDITFDINAPRQGTDNIAVVAELNNYDLSRILIAVNPDTLPTAVSEMDAQTSGKINLRGLPNAASGEANLVAVDGVVSGEAFDRIDTDVIFENSQVSIDKFIAQFGEGLLDVKGLYDNSSGRFSFKFDSKDVPIERVQAFFPKNPDSPIVDGVINGDGAASGISGDPKTYDINFEGVGKNITINGSRFGNIDFDGETIDHVLNVNVRSVLRGKTQLANASLKFNESGVPLHLVATLNKSPLEPYIAIVRPPDDASIGISGTATGVINVDGNLFAPDSTGKNAFTTDLLKGTATFSQFDLRIDETPLYAVEPVKLTFDASQATISSAKFEGSGSNVVVSGTKAFVDEGINNLLIDGRLNLRILNALSKNMFFSGLADVEMRLTGPNIDSRLNGIASVQNATISTFVGGERLTFERLKGSAIFTSDQVQLENLNGYLGGGRINATGGATLENLKVSGFRFHVRGSNVTASLPTDFVTTSDLDLQINGRTQNDVLESLISGTIAAKRSVYSKDIDVADLLSSRSGASLSQTSSGTSLINAPNLDIRVLGRNALRVQNNLADITATLDLRVTGNTNYPQVAGRISGNQGTIFYRDDRYDVQRGVLTFPPNSTTIMPYVNLQAETNKNGYQIFVSLNGPLSDSEALNVTLRSNPSLPQADVVSLITTGNLANTANGIPTYAQSGINTAAELLTDQILNRPITKATDRLFGLNKFQLDPLISGERQNPTARLTVGRQINRNLLITYSTNLSADQNQVVAFEYEVSNRLSFVAQYEQSSLSNVTQNRNVFSFEIRLKRRF